VKEKAAPRPMQEEKELEEANSQEMKKGEGEKKKKDLSAGEERGGRMGGKGKTQGGIGMFEGGPSHLNFDPHGCRGSKKTYAGKKKGNLKKAASLRERGVRENHWRFDVKGGKKIKHFPKT